MKTCPRGMKVQSVLVSRAFAKTAADARAWVLAHDFRATKVDVTARYFRFRQAAPTSFVRGTFRTITLRPGVRTVVACPRARAVRG